MNVNVIVKEIKIVKSNEIESGAIWNKREVKKNVNKLARGVLIYELIMFLVVVIDMIRRTVPFYASNDENLIDKIFNEAMNSGTSSIIAVFVGLLFLLFYFRKYNYGKVIFDSKEKMTGATFLIILTIFMSAQAFFSLSSMGIEACFNQLGFSILGDIDAATSRSSTVSMLLYASFIGPITEEIVFRGYIMRGFQKHGSYYAIVISAVIFGAFHGNLMQSLFATLVGLVLGYVAMNYSIRWSILLHIINNFVFGDVLSYMTKNMSESAQSIIIYTIEAIFFIGMVAILVRRRDNIKRKMKEIKIDKKMLVVAFTSVWMLIFLAIQLLLAISGIEKLPI